MIAIEIELLATVRGGGNADGDSPFTSYVKHVIDKVKRASPEQQRAFEKCERRYKAWLGGRASHSAFGGCEVLLDVR